MLTSWHPQESLSKEYSVHMLMQYPVFLALLDCCLWHAHPETSKWRCTSHVAHAAWCMQVVAKPGGAGQLIVNGVPYDEYFRDLGVRAHVVAPLMMVPRTLPTCDLKVDVHGGGLSGQVSDTCIG